jgi:hypothetical protein
MDSGNDQYDIASLEILNKCHLDLFPKKQTVYDDYDCSTFETKIPLLAGEYNQYMGKCWFGRVRAEHHARLMHL